jgi:hypothetical protein
MNGAGFSSPVRSKPVLVGDLMYLFECLLFPPIHYPQCVRPLTWIQRERCLCLSTIRRTLYLNSCLLSWWGSRIVQGNILPCDFHDGIHAWQHCWSGNGFGGHYLTLVVLIVHVKSGLEVMIVDSCEA